LAAGSEGPFLAAFFLLGSELLDFLAGFFLEATSALAGFGYVACFSSGNIVIFASTD
jgi:hypothetical protein